MNFWKLTHMGTGKVHHVNLDHVEQIVPHGEGGSMIYFAGDPGEGGLPVQESPEKIMGSIQAAFAAALRGEVA